jgi:molybdopterin-guanine dinucleotide biosynthesis protein A/rhodanese-related sulfurtransferase
VTTAPFAGAVLCGGRSTRMGQDKALLPIEGRAMAVRVAAALRAAGAAAVVAIGGDLAALAALGLDGQPDDEPDGGPFPATLQALRGACQEIVVVLSCDLVAPSGPVIVELVDRLAGAPPEVLAAVPVADGHHQWTHAAWRRAALDPLAAARAGGTRSLRRAVPGLVLLEVHDLPQDALRDADGPGDLPGGGTLPAMDVPEIDVTQLAALREQGAPLIDVREPDEHEEARVPGAVLIPLGEVPDRITEVPTDQTVYVICARGGRSAKAVEHLRGQGIDAVNVAGGTLGWIDAGLPTDHGPGGA